MQSKDDLHEQIDEKLGNPRYLGDFYDYRSPLLHGDGFGEVARLIHIRALD